LVAWFPSYVIFPNQRKNTDKQLWSTIHQTPPHKSHPWLIIFVSYFLGKINWI
jgi:hypothetical protein